MDFRYLNAITVKCKYPIPIIDEFLDELSQASWFTSLDLTAGFHQVRLKAGEEFKTAFQTHFGHYEFKVMAFGLSGGPATFQKAMNIPCTHCLGNVYYSVRRVKDRAATATYPWGSEKTRHVNA